MRGKALKNRGFRGFLGGGALAEIGGKLRRGTYIELSGAGVAASDGLRAGWVAAGKTLGGRKANLHSG